jgi:hypothetical protein
VVAAVQTLAKALPMVALAVVQTHRPLQALPLPVQVSQVKEITAAATTFQVVAVRAQWEPTPQALNQVTAA